MSVAVGKSEGGLDVNLKMPSESWLLVRSSCGLTFDGFQFPLVRAFLTSDNSLVRMRGIWNGRGGNSPTVSLLEDRDWGSRWEEYSILYLVSKIFISVLIFSPFMSKAEAEELANKVRHLTAENAALTTEINQLIEDSENLRQENAKLMVSFLYPLFCLLSSLLIE